MSLRARLALIVGVVLVVVMLIVGAIVVDTTRDTLVAQVDEQVRSTAVRIELVYDSDDVQTEGGEDGAPPAPDAASDEDTQFRSVARYVYSSEGEELFALPYGFSDDPRSRPDIGPIPSDDLFRTINNIRTVPSVNGNLTYRALVQLDGNDNFVITAAPLDQANEAVDDLIQTMALSGFVGVLIGAVVAWALITREFRPVERMILTAERIGEGALGRRIPEFTAETELGRLSRSLNRMLGRIEDAARAQERSESRLRQFVADAAHELRTPLTSIRGYAELYRQGYLKAPARLGPAMQRVEEEGIRMARILDEMLLLARLDQQQAMLEPLNLSELVASQMAAFRRTETDRPVTEDIAEGLMVNGEEVHLRQVIGNLLANVRMHTPSDTGVMISLTREDSTAELRVEDTGPGIGVEFQSQVFDRFTREDPARTRATGGAGLGLAVAAAIVRVHSGTIQLESTPGKGSTFIVRLPLIEDEES